MTKQTKEKMKGNTVQLDLSKRSNPYYFYVPIKEEEFNGERQDIDSRLRTICWNSMRFIKNNFGYFKACRGPREYYNRLFQFEERASNKPIGDFCSYTVFADDSCQETHRFPWVSLVIGNLKSNLILEARFGQTRYFEKYPQKEERKAQLEDILKRFYSKMYTDDGSFSIISVENDKLPVLKIGHRGALSENGGSSFSGIVQATRGLASSLYFDMIINGHWNEGDKGNVMCYQVPSIPWMGTYSVEHK